MKITKSQLQELIKEAFQDGFFDEVTEEILNDDREVDYLLKAFLSELKKKKVVRGKKLFKKVICPKNKRYVAALKKCVVKTAGEKARKRRAMKKAARKKRGKMAQIVRKRKKSMKKRKAFGLRRKKR
jgi:hypothetical protein|tara:strand:+ start:198 stop:578 length:381 start_codon:yes stop_codon:yes gene_type:complete